MKPGTSLIELLIAIGAISVVLITIAAAASQALSAGIYSRTQAIATKQAEEQMERVRAYRDSNGLAALTSDPLIDCVANRCSLDANLIKSQSEITVENLKVWFQISILGNCPTPQPQIPPQPNSAQVTVYAEWTDAKGVHQSKVVSCFSGWRG